ncbi:histidinol dehydrogenase [Candidatus Micrarchaeota archaeon]|nr:histidinol dehydrogenase [Candidatus Micrarchaeota archaeon]
MRIYRLGEISEKVKKRILLRAELDVGRAVEIVKPILKDVEKNGDKAVLKYIKKFDRVDLRANELKVRKSEIDEAYRVIDRKLLKAIEHAARNIRKFHERQKSKEYFIEIEKGVVVGRRVIPLRTAGLYVPKGKAVYPSVMLMLGIPASVAGVKEIVACTSAQSNGELDPATLVASDIAGVHKVFRIGGAQAIAAMAYGTGTVPRVDVIAGPGSAYVSAAQRLVKLNTRVDFPAGPSEGMVMADRFADPRLVAADVLSEAEHGPESSGVLVTDSMGLALVVRKEFKRMLERLPEQRQRYVETNMKLYSCIIVTKSLKEAIDFVNDYAPEHLVINTRNPKGVVRKIENAGTICLGENTPITAGNFICGPNAILPTGRYARHYAGVSVDTFVKKPTVEYLSKQGLKGVSEDLLKLCEFEGFPAHSNAVKVRLNAEND